MAEARAVAPTAEELLAHLTQVMGVESGQQIVHVELLPARVAEHAEVAPPLAAPLSRALQQMGIGQLYAHQAECVERVRRGENVVVATSTSSGKTLCYNLPVIESILHDRAVRAIYLYPINALINDQLKSLFRINLALGKEAVGVARYTGALSAGQRKSARERNPHIWLTNPEMLHLSYLLWHGNWEDLWRNLRYIVLDEVHTYRGVFGANMAQLVRRVVRMASHYGSHPQFICCSATIANPQELAERLTGQPFTVVGHDGAGRGRRLFALWNPPLLANDGTNRRRSYTEESVQLLLHCVQANYNTIVFARARALTERMLRMGRSLSEKGNDARSMELISSYRAGYLAEEREAIENRLKAGEIRGIITTNALELGIDIGGLDAAILSGYPGTIMSTWQQAGRAGRRGLDALILLVASQNPLDQYYVKHPREFFAQPHELAVLDLDNPYVRLKHLLCAARELALLPSEIQSMPADAGHAVARLREHGILRAPPEGQSESLEYPKASREIHFRVSLRSAGHETYHIIDENHNEIGTIEPPNVFREAHPGAIYQHGGEDYRVTYLDRHRHEVHVREENAPHYTRATSSLSIVVETTSAQQQLFPGEAALTAGLGSVQVEETIHGYQELRMAGDEMVKRVNLDYPLSTHLNTVAMWFAFPRALRTRLGKTVTLSAPEGEAPEEEQGDGHKALLEGLHAIQHLVTGVMPLLVMCDPHDVDGYYHLEHPDVSAPAVFIYDAYEGGIGLAEVLFRDAHDLLLLAYDTITHCPCTDGCPSCIQSGACRLRNEALDKHAAQLILEFVLGARLHTQLPDRATTPPRRVRSSAAESRIAVDAAAGWQRALDDVILRASRSATARAQHAAAEAARQSLFLPGDIVEHSPYGRGVVISSRLESSRELVTVHFAQRQRTSEIDASKGALRKVVEPH